MYAKGAVSTAPFVRWAGAVTLTGMCRNIRTLYNFEPPATEDEIHAAALQYVRKISGFTEAAPGQPGGVRPAVHEVAHVSADLLDSLETGAPPKDREVEAAKARARAAERYGTAPPAAA